MSRISGIHTHGAQGELVSNYQPNLIPMSSTTVWVPIMTNLYWVLAHAHMIPPL